MRRKHHDVSLFNHDVLFPQRYLNLFFRYHHILCCEGKVDCVGDVSVRPPNILNPEKASVCFVLVRLWISNYSSTAWEEIRALSEPKKEAGKVPWCCCLKQAKHQVKSRRWQVEGTKEGHCKPPPLFPNIARYDLDLGCPEIKKRATRQCHCISFKPPSLLSF